jgi:hypothetical protein
MNFARSTSTPEQKPVPQEVPDRDPPMEDPPVPQPPPYHPTPDEFPMRDPLPDRPGPDEPSPVIEDPPRPDEPRPMPDVYTRAATRSAAETRRLRERSRELITNLVGTRRWTC